LAALNANDNGSHLQLQVNTGLLLNSSVAEAHIWASLPMAAYTQSTYANMQLFIEKNA
jgi:hypothetical protein